MADYAAVIDVTRCIDCRCCAVSCKDQFALNDYPPNSVGMPFEGQSWIHVEGFERGTFPKVKFSSVPIMCMHCDNAPCIKAGTGGAVYKRPDGIVIIDPLKSVGQKEIVAACPYGVIFWNDEKNIPQKCTFCVHRLEKGEVPRCMLACPSGAITIGDYEQVMKDVRKYEPVPLHPEYKTQNRVYYIGLPRAFITGALVDGKTGKCLEGTDVILKDPTGATQSTKSDVFGDFWFDGLDAQTHTWDEHEFDPILAPTAEHVYELTITKGTKSKTMQVPLVTSTNLGDITL